MKKIACVAIVLLFSGCKKEAEPSPFWGTVSVVLNGQAWIPPGWGVQIAGSKTLWINSLNEPPCNPDVVNFEIHKQNPDGYLREQIAVGKIPPIIGTYPVEVMRNCNVSTAVGANYSLLGADGDVLMDSYKVLESENNFVEVTSYHASTGEIKGNFNITFVFNTGFDRRKDVQSIPDTVRFTNGQFHTRINLKRQ